MCTLLTEAQSLLLCSFLDFIVFLSTIVFLVAAQEELVFTGLLFERIVNLTFLYSAVLSCTLPD